ncbi:LysR family regulatory protein (plasmid) [Caballeronia insecticola]|uniref:LysR family regulatory protein n=1 Tax=Caballeronia insecticola TaxID=758793 RepID=A0A060PJU2_9BURK|nr:LysR family regulatory protein [Caballeronia insecticola]
MSGLNRDVVCSVSTSALACEIVLSTGAVGIVDSLTASAYESRGIETIQLYKFPLRPVSLLQSKLRPASDFAQVFVRALAAQAARFDVGSVEPAKARQ